MEIKFLMIGRASILMSLILAPVAAVHAGDQTFSKTIKLREQLDLAIVSGAGTIQISQGPAGLLTITGRVRANDWHPTDDRLRDIAARPPIQQSGNIVRIGSTDELAHVIIDYEIQAPADSMIQASATLGDIFDDGVGSSARFHTGSGNIHATGLSGSIDASSKEGDIEVEQIGKGEVKAISGTGTLQLRDLHGALHAATSDGAIRVSGEPSGDWSVRTAKGDIELSLGRAPCTIDAQAGGGLVHSDLPVEGTTHSDPHHLAGKINGGGPTVILQVGEGEIRIR